MVRITIGKSTPISPRLEAPPEQRERGYGEHHQTEQDREARHEQEAQPLEHEAPEDADADHGGDHREADRERDVAQRERDQHGHEGSEGRDADQIAEHRDDQRAERDRHQEPQRRLRIHRQPVERHGPQESVRRHHHGGELFGTQMLA
jgi:hypothetical protein